MDESKSCSICKTIKSVTEFSKNKAKKDGLQTDCKACAKAKFKSYWLENKATHYESVKKTKEAYRIKASQYCYDILKKNGCIDCGENDPIVLEFDHVRDKTCAVSTLLRYGYSLSKIQLEIDKCVVRCANCHRRKTAKDFNWYKNLDTGL